MNPLPIPFFTEEDYLIQERESETKNEYYNGEIFDMSGASEKHNLIVVNVIRELSSRLKKTPCRVYPGDMRLKIPQTGLYTYPDIMVICGKREFADDYRDMITNPDVIIEVLSDSTEKYDRGAKFEHYRRLPSLKEYVLISQHKRKIEKFFKQDSGLWMFSESGDDHPEIMLESVNCPLALDEVYEKVED